MSHHLWFSDDSDPPAFLVCCYCGLEHTLRDRLGIRQGPATYIREPEGEWRPRIPPMPSCPWRPYVKDVVLYYFRAPSPYDDGAVRLWYCYGFDPRYGYRMRTRDQLGPEYKLDVSPRAIAGTWVKFPHVEIL